MRAVPTTEQEMLRVTATRLAGAMAVGSPVDLDRFDDAAAWAGLRDAGFLVLRMRDEGRPLATGYEAALVIEALGGALSPAPLLGNLLAYELLALAGASEDLLAEMAEGRARVGLLLSADLEALSGDGAGFVLDGAGADFVLGISTGPEGARVIRYAAPGGQGLGADLTRPLRSGADAAGEVVGEPLSDEALTRWTALTLALTAADAVGVMREGLSGVVQYSAQRNQYDALIGSFQAVQHLCADMLVQVEAAASAARHAAWAVDVLPADEALKAARTAKAYVGPASQAVCETVMQVYGGIGQTWEHSAHLRTRRVLLDRQLFGDEAVHLPLLTDAMEAA